MRARARYLINILIFLDIEFFSGHTQLTRFLLTALVSNTIVVDDPIFFSSASLSSFALMWKGFDYSIKVVA